MAIYRGVLGALSKICHGTYLILFQLYSMLVQLIVFSSIWGRVDLTTQHHFY